MMMFCMRMNALSPYVLKGAWQIVILILIRNSAVMGGVNTRANVVPIRANLEVIVERQRDGRDNKLEAILLH